MHTAEKDPVAETSQKWRQQLHSSAFIVCLVYLFKSRMSKLVRLV